MRFGVKQVIATVIEHRGPLGVGGRELLRVSFPIGESIKPIETEVPLEEVTPIDPTA